MSTSPLPHIEVIVPVYNEEENIPLLLVGLDETVARLKLCARVTYLFVNDGSSDRSLEVLEALHCKRCDIRVIDLVHNFGHNAALACGIQYFRGDIAVIMDADLQDDPAAIEKMFALWKGGAMTVVAERGKRGERGWFFFQCFYYLLHRMTRVLPPFSFGTYSLLDRSVVQRLIAFGEHNRYMPGLVSLASRKIIPVRVNRNPRAHGESRVGSLGLIHLAITAFISFSGTPIRMVSMTGIAASLFAIGAGMFIVGIKIFTTYAIPGWASLMTALAFSSGIQLLCLGIIGEYISRMYDEVKARPLFLVHRVYDINAMQPTLPHFSTPPS